MDQVEEWRRLQASYARLTDEELQALADQSYELTEIAKQALKTEIIGRRLQFQLREAPAAPGFNPKPNEFDASELELVVVQRVWDLPEARRVKGILDDAGIPSYLGPDNLESVEAFTSGFDDGVDLKVRYIDNQRLTVLARSLPLDPQGETEYTPVCPKCRSSEIVFQSLEAAKDSNSAFEAKFNWSCDACGYQWKDDGIEKEQGRPPDLGLMGCSS